MKTKILSLIMLSLLSISSFGQSITLTEPNPSFMPPNNWPYGNSWNMLTGVYNDMVSLNNSSPNLSGTNTFSGTNNFTGTVNITGSITGLKGTTIQDSALTKVTLTAAQTGSVVLLKALAGDTIVLPAATTANLGVQFRVLIAYSATSVGHCINTAGSDVFYGTSFVSSVTTPFTNPYLSTANKTMLMSPTTTGGLAGGEIDLYCIGYGRWNVHALLYATGTIATPFKN